MPTTEEASEAFILVTASMTLMRQIHQTEADSEEYVELSKQWLEMVGEMQSAEMVYTYIWMLAGMSVACIDGLIDMVCSVQDATADGLASALGVPEAIKETMLDQLPDLHDVVNFESIMQQGVLNAIAIAEQHGDGSP